MSNPPFQLLHGKHDSITCVDITSKNNLLLSCSEDGYVTTFDLKSPSNHNTNQEWILPNQSIGTCTYTTTSATENDNDNYIHIGTDIGMLLKYDSRMIDNNNNATAVNTWNVCDDSELNVIRRINNQHNHNNDASYFLIGDDDGFIYSVSEDDNNIDSDDDIVKVVGQHDNVCTDIAVGSNVPTNDTICWSCGLDSTVREWSASSSQSSSLILDQRQCLELGEPGDGFVYSLGLNEEETLLCGALGSGEVGLFQIDTNKSTSTSTTSLISKMQGHSAATTNVQFTEWDKSGQIISCGNDQRIILWDILQDEEAVELSDDNVTQLGISPMEQSFFDWKLMKMRWKHEDKINSVITYDMDSSSAMVIVCDITPHITVYLMEG